MRRFPLPFAVLLVAFATGCVKARAQKPEPPVTLTTPAAPDRVVVPATLPEPIEPAPAPSPPAPPPSRPPMTPSRPADRPATAPPTAPAPVEPAPPPQVLQTTAMPAEIEKQTRVQLAAATRDLERVNEKQLNANGRTQLEALRGFIRGAEAALQIKNFLLARELADKAAALAKELAR